MIVGIPVFILVSVLLFIFAFGFCYKNSSVYSGML